MNLHGNWRPVRAELDGQEAPTMALERMEFVLSEATYLYALPVKSTTRACGAAPNLP